MKNGIMLCVIVCALAACDKNKTTGEGATDAGDASMVTVDGAVPDAADVTSDADVVADAEIDADTAPMDAGDSAVATDDASVLDAAVDAAPDASGPLTLANVAQAFAEILCADPTCAAGDVPGSSSVRTVMGAGSMNALIFTGGLTGDACLAHASEIFNGMAELLEPLVEAGYITFDPERAQACIDEHRFVCSNAALRFEDGWCGSVRGLTEIGEQCDHDSQCIAGEHVYCSRGGFALGGGAPSIENICVDPTHEVGDVCTTVNECRQRGYARVTCEGDTELHCVGTRVVTVALGEACDSGFGDAEVVDYVRDFHACPTGTYCPTSRDGDSVCTASLAEGDTCTISEACARGLVCANDSGELAGPSTTTGTFTCQPIQLIATSGLGCGTLYNGVCDVANGFVCVADATKRPAAPQYCRRVEDGSVNTPCSLGGDVAAYLLGDASECDFGTYCGEPGNLLGSVPAAAQRIDLGGRCLPKRADGEICGTAEQCISGLCSYDSGSGESRCAAGS